MKHIIALDVGTSSMRAILYGEDGAIGKSFGWEYHTTFPQPGHVEQDPVTWKDAAVRVLSQMGEYIKNSGLSAEGIAVTSQRSSLIPMDCQGVPLYNAIMWQDKRTLEQCEQLKEKYGMEKLYRLTGLRINPYFILPKILWLRQNMPKIYAAAHKFIGVQDYVVHCLTGEYVTDHSQACRTMLMNITTFSWEQELLDIAGIRAEQLPKLVEPGSKAGELSADMAALTCLPQGLPVVVSGGDQQNAAVGLGVVHSGIAEANTGTGSFVLSWADTPVFDESCRVLCQASAIAGKWVIEAGIFNTGAIYRWFKEQYCKDLNDHPKPYVVMDDEAMVSGPGAHGVVMLPHFEGSAAPYWNPVAKGLFFNLSLGTNRGDLNRAILEGIAMEIADDLVLIQQLSGDLTEINVAGGMVKSNLFCQIQADCYNRKVVRYQNNEASSLGAVIVAATALGLYDNFDQAYKAMASERDSVFEPDTENSPFYEDLMEARRRLYFTLADNHIYEDFMGVKKATAGK